MGTRKDGFPSRNPESKLAPLPVVTVCENSFLRRRRIHGASCPFRSQEDLKKSRGANRRGGAASPEDFLVSPTTSVDGGTVGEAPRKKLGI